MFKRYVLAGAAALVLCGAAQAAAPLPAPAPAWAHEASDLRPDPAVRWGLLPNGLRYAIMKNATPPGEASVRLAFDAGSLMEADDQQGLAHFIEHMAFNGTRNVREGEMVKILERHGLAFGPDTNASTGFDQTVFMLDLPETDAETVDTALFLMRETAGEVLFEAEAIDRERGIVLSEERTRDGPGLRIARKRLDFLFKDQLLARRLPIGAPEVLRTAKRDRFIDLYRRYYRPERAVLAVVGDIDPDAIEAKIKTRFSDWTASGPAGGEPELGRVAPRGTEAKVVVEPGGPATVALTWLYPPDLDRDTRAERTDDVVRGLGFAVLNRRLERIARGAEPPFVSASAGRANSFDSADTVTLSVSTRPGEWSKGMAAAEQEQRRIARHGVLASELQREIAETRAALKAAVAGANTRRSAAVASAIVDAAGSERVFTAPAESLAVFEAAVSGLTAETVWKAMAAQFGGQGPLIFLTSPSPVEGGEAAVLQAYRTSLKTEVAPAAEQASKAWPYTDFGAPGAVAERREVAEVGATFVRFANGVRLTVKPTKLREDQILVSVRAGDGYLDLPRDRVTPAWAVPFAYGQGGLGKLTADEMQQALASEVYGAGLSIGEDAFVLSGGTRPESFAVQMQVLAAFLTDAGWRPEPFERLRAAADTVHAQYDATPGGVLAKNADLFRSGDDRWAFPSPADIKAARLEDARDLVQGPLGSEPVEVVVVGDIDVETAIARTAKTFGALPARAERVPPAPEARRVAFPQGGGEPVRLTHKGRADQGLAWIGWRTDDFWSDRKEARTLRLVQEILQLRLTEELREGQAVTYSPSTGSEASWVFDGYGFVSAAIEAPPEKLDGFFADVRKIAAALRAEPPSADELARARKPRIEALQRARAGNEFWLGALADAQTDPRRLESIRTQISDLEAIRPHDVRRVARKYLKDAAAFRVTVVPDPAVAAKAAAE